MHMTNSIDTAFMLQRHVLLKPDKTAAPCSCATVNFRCSCELVYNPFWQGWVLGCVVFSVACSGFLAVKHRGFSQCSGVEEHLEVQICWLDSYLVPLVWLAAAAHFPALHTVVFSQSAGNSWKGNESGVRHNVHIVIYSRKPMCFSFPSLTSHGWPGHRL